MNTPTPAQRKVQADLVRDLTNQWESAANNFDSATVAVEGAQGFSAAAFRAYNTVAWKIQEHSGASDAEKMDAFSKKITSDTAAAAVPPLMDAATVASLARGAVQIKLDAATAALKENPGAVENTGGI